MDEALRSTICSPSEQAQTAIVAVSPTHPIGEAPMVTPPQNNPPDNQRPGTGQSRSGSDDLKDTARHLGEDARHLGEEARIQGKEQLEQLRGTAAESLDKLAESAHAAASTLQHDDVGHLSEYVSDLASRMSELSSTLRTKSVDEVFQDLGRIARENPALFVTGSLAIGFGISRFARASQGKAQHESDHYDPGTGDYAAAQNQGTTATGARSQDLTGRSSYSADTGAQTFTGTSPSQSTTTPSGNPPYPASGQTGTSSGTQGGIH